MKFVRRWFFMTLILCLFVSVLAALTWLAAHHIVIFCVGALFTFAFLLDEAGW
jgi:hypothetical protein